MKEQIDLSGDVALVTGAAGGIGSAVAEELAKEGATTVVTDVSVEEGTAVAADLDESYDATVVFRQLDVSDYDACETVIGEVVEEFGSIDVLVNVAAGGLRDHGSLKPFYETTPDDWQIQFDVTFRGPVNTTHAAIQHMMEQESGAIVNFISEAHKGQERGDDKLYASSKGGVAVFTKALSREIGEFGIRINGISPAATHTPATTELIEKHGDRMLKNYALNRLGQPEDSAYMAVFLASDAADWVTGQVISVNGGYS
ncbi:SDR family NAD(P)-dependent oxidoreductase [Halorarius litoreus]|uniref:SDR family NAD(P)-dependent oxidoreductase n=1 Tax=Halorarius litoreus TaxID=2962676 RepID=UPI0020CD9E38|nr:SDR family oxidoreductase [Halorarius litoreus]